MDEHNLSDLESAMPSSDFKAEVKLFGHFVDPGKLPEVPDPYYGGGSVGSLLLTDDEKLVSFNDNGIFWRDTSPDVEPHWTML